MVDKDKLMQSLELYFTTTGTVTISDEGLVSCAGNVELKLKPKHEKLPVAFDRVSGYFGCWGNQLTTLEGAPQSVGGSFSCSNNQLTTLEGAPQSVGGSFDCGSNQLISLQEGPKSVGADFDCRNNQLTTLEGAPKIVPRDFSCYNNQLTSLEHAPKIVGRDFWCNNNRLKSLEGLPAIPGTLFLSYRRKLPLLRCLLAQKVEFVPRQRNKTVQNILNKYAKQGRREMFWCQKELEDAGFEENARW